MFVQARQAPVDAQPGVCVVQELTNLYLAWIIHEHFGLTRLTAFD
jgi:hypothetical protein